MPTEPLTDAEIASLRNVLPPVARGDSVTLPRVDYEDARALIQRAADELEQLRRRDREQAAGEEVLRQQLRDAERKIEMLRGG